MSYWFWLGGTSKGAAGATSKELLARLRTVTRRPATDRDLTDAKAYQFLTDAQIQLTHLLAAQVPELMKGPLEKLTSTDGGATWTTTKVPLGHMEVYPATTQPPLIEGPLWDMGADYTREGTKTIRLVRPRTFPDGAPYARYVPLPGVIDDVSQPVLQPVEARSVLPWLAAGMWAASGGNIENPDPYFAQATTMLWGDRRVPGDVGLIPSYKLQHFSSGLSGRQRIGGLWWRSPDLAPPL